MKEKNSRIVAFELKAWGVSAERVRMENGGRSLFATQDLRCPHCFIPLPTEEQLVPPTTRIRGFLPSWHCSCEGGVPGYAAVRCTESAFSWGCGHTVWRPVSDMFLADAMMRARWVKALFYKVKYAA